MKKLLDIYNRLLDWLMCYTSRKYKHDHVYEKQVELLYHQIPLVLISVVLVATGLVSFFYSAASQNNALIWLVSVYIISLIRFMIYLKWKRNRLSLNIKGWAQISIAFTLISGFQWAYTVLIFFNSSSMVDVGILTLVLLGMVSGVVGSLSVIPAAFAAYTAPVAVALVVTMINTNDPELIKLSYMVSIFIIASSLFSRNTYKSNMHAILLHIENSRLIEELKVEKERAESANLSKSKFLAAASHDLRQPLQAMMLFNESLKENLTSAENLHLIGKITESHNALCDLLNALLDISKLDANGISVQKKQFNIAPIFEEVLNKFLPVLEQKHQQLITSKANIIVYSDPVIVKRILQNLISNAINHCPEDTLIMLESKKINDKCLINVKDNGKGINKEEQSAIFQEYHQLNNPERDRNKGLGLGLAIVKRLATLLDTKINLKSSSVQGSNFSFNLPLSTSSFIEKPTAIPPSSQTLNSISVLLVEDEDQIREALTQLLERWGCTTFQSETISESISIVKNNDINLIITDYRLRKNETGLMVIDEINKIDASIPAIIVTGDTEPNVLKNLDASGHIIFHKPIKPANLRVAIQQLMKTDLQ